MSPRGGTEPRDEGYGCSAFGHLASPFVDAELSRSEHDRFATHLETCRPCQKLTSEYRAIDVAARSPVPEPSAGQWDAAWSSIARAIAADRSAAAESPLSFLRGGAPRPRRRVPAFVRPLGYAAAASLLVVVMLAVQSRIRPDAAPSLAGSTLAPEGPAEVLSVACKSPQYMPVVYTTGGDDPFTVIQCVLIETDS